jgi:hypothetical protein
MRCNVSFDKLKIRELGNLIQVFETGAIVQFIINDYFVVGVLLAEQYSDMGGNET